LQCQEVLINIVDSISTLKANGKKGALVSLDIKKAFDSTSHKYLQLVYNFFNFGPNFIRWLNLLGTNRRACIILDNEISSAFFDLQRGNAQGNTISPYIFNLGFQILLFKINYELQIHGAIDPPAVPPDLTPLPREVSTRPFKVFAYADDANTLVKMEIGTLTKLRKVLDDFSKLSGLECNVDKTTLLQVGSDTPISQEITELGFAIVNEVTILGLKIVGSGADTSDSLLSIQQKLQKQVSHWSRFNLSLPGRIAIAKTMLYSQVNYLGCFLMIPKNVLERYATIINNFVSGKLNIGKNRFTKSIEMGGLGLFDLQSFLDAQKIAWIKRAKSVDDWWKIVIYSKCYGNVYNIRSREFDSSREPCITSIVAGYENLITNFTKTNENFLDAFMFENRALTIGLRDNRCLNKNNFDVIFFNAHQTDIKKLRTSDLYNGETYVSLNDFRTNTGIPISIAYFRMLKGMVETAKTRYRKELLNERKTVDIATFINRSKRGSKRFRKILFPELCNYIPHNIIKFSSNIDIVVGLDGAKSVNSSWHNNVFNNSTKTFLFKLYNNILGYNSAVAHFVRNHSPNCTFCDIAGVQDIFNETPLHLFFGCTTTETFVETMFKWFAEDDQFELSCKEIFTYFDRPGFSPARNKVFTVFAKLTLKFLWDCKQRYILPYVNHGKISISIEIRSLLDINSNFKKTYTSSGVSMNILE
jgi:hypothetical protein